MVLEFGSRMFPQGLCVRDCSYLSGFLEGRGTFRRQELVEDWSAGVRLALCRLLPQNTLTKVNERRNGLF